MGLLKVAMIGGAVAGVGAVAWVLMSDDEDDKSKASKKGQGKTPKKRVDTAPPSPPEGGADSDGVFRLDGQGLRQVVCAAREAKGPSELITVLRGLQLAVKNSGAKQVDVRNTGLLDKVVSAEDFSAEINRGVDEIKGAGGFFWPVTKALVTDKLGGLPACDAPPTMWEGVASGAVQQAVTAESAPEFLWGIERARAEELAGR